MSSRDGIAERGVGSNQLLVFEVAHEVQLLEDEIHGASRSQTSSLGYDDLTLGGAELEKLKSLRITVDV